MNEQNDYNFTPLGTKWLWFITYISFPLGSLSNILSIINVDFSSMDNLTFAAMSVMAFYCVALPIATSIFLHKRMIEGYFLSFITPFTFAFFFVYLWFIGGSTNPSSDSGSIIGAGAIAFINYYYMKKRRFLFTKNEIGPEKFNFVGIKTALVVCLVVLAAITLYSAMLQSVNSIDQQLYNDLYAEKDELQEENANLTSTIDELNLKNSELIYKADFVDSYVRFFTETGEKYHRYECSHIQDASSIYYIFIDDPALSFYSPCSDCNP